MLHLQVTVNTYFQSLDPTYTEGKIIFSNRAGGDCCVKRHADLFETSAEPFKHSLHVSSFLHGNDSGVVLLVDPDQEVPVVVVPEGKIKLPD